MRKLILPFVLIIFIVFKFGLDGFSQENVLEDERDGKQYETIEIGNQFWMAQNMNFETENSWWYNDSKRKGKKHGRLYTWEDAQEVCPDGWHLPSDKDWTELIDYYGGADSAGIELSIIGTSGFDVRLSGFRDSLGVFYDMGHDANFWTSVSVDKNNAWRCFIDRGYHGIVQDYYRKEGGLSVRCIKD